MSFKKSMFIVVLLFFLVLPSGCNRENNESGDNDNYSDESQMTEEITELENSMLEIMQQADLVPVVEAKMIPEEEVEEEEEEEAESAVSELTYEETILSEVLEKEIEETANYNGNGEDELPESTEVIWDGIKMAITGLHEQWNELEPVLIRENISEDTTGSFGETLDSLTILSTEEDHLGVITTANELTMHLSQFLEPFAEKPEAVAYEAKYHVRNIVIESYRGNYNEARGSLEFLKSKRPALTEPVEKEDAEELETALANLERALDNENHELVKLKSALVMENLVEIQ